MSVSIQLTYQFLTLPLGPLEARSSIFKLMRFEIENGNPPHLFLNLNIVLASLVGRKDQYILIFKMKAGVFL